MTTDRDHSLPRRLAGSLVTLAVLAATLYVLLTKPWEATGTRLTADFDHAGQGLTTGSPVKIRGVRVGRVAEIELRSDGRARLTLRINEGVRVPASTHASLEPESMFGPKFIDLIPGKGEATGPYLADRAHIRSSGNTEDLSDMLTGADRMLAAIDPRDVSTIMSTLAVGLGGQDKELRGLIENGGTIVAIGHRHRERARTFTADLARLAEIRGIGAAVTGIAGDTNAIMDTAGSGQDRLRRLAGGTGRLAGTLAGGLQRHDGGLGETFRSAERAVNVIYAQLGIAGASVRGMTRALPAYRSVGWPAAPRGKNGFAAKILLPNDPCELLIGLCPTGTAGGGTATPDTGGR